jgi:uncharacterized membrane protein
MASLLPAAGWMTLAIIFGVCTAITFIVIAIIADDMYRDECGKFFKKYCIIPVISLIAALVCIICCFRAPEHLHVVQINENYIQSRVDIAIKNYLKNLSPQEKYELIKNN